jgi:hypothetical protein
MEFNWNDELIIEWARVATAKFSHHNLNGGWTGYDKELELFKKSKQPKKEYEIIQKDYEILKSCPIEGDIHSVKRLSDGEVFTVGDKISFENNPVRYTIGKFTISDNYLMVSVYALSTLFHISLIKKVKQPLFTTEDGKEIFLNDTFYYIGDAMNVCRTRCLFEGDGDFTNFKTFSTREAAEEYVLMNKPVFSVKDIHNYFDTWVVKPNDYVREKIIELAKSKYETNNQTRNTGNY